MIQGRNRRQHAAAEPSALAAEVEGYLLLQTHHDDARRAAQALCDRMPWLTTSQAEELTRHYVDQHLRQVRVMLRTTVRRAEELREEYEARFAQLRSTLLKRHATCACALLAFTTGIGSAFCTLTR